MRTETLKPESITDIVIPSDPQVSPSGDKAAVIVTRTSLDENKYIDELLVINTSTAGIEYSLVLEGVSNPRWNPLNHKLAFRSSSCGEKTGYKTCIHVLDPGASTARLVARLKWSASRLSWLDGSRLVAVASKEIREKDKDGDYHVVEGLPVWANGAGFVDEERSHIIAIDTWSGSTRWLSSGNYDVNDAVPSPRGDRVAAVVTPSRLRPYIQELRIIHLDGEQETILPAEQGWSILATGWSPSGDTLLLWGHRRPRGDASHVHVWTVDPQTGRVECVSCSLGLDTAPYIQSDTFWLRGSTNRPQWTRHGIHFLVNRGGRLHLYRVEEPGAEPELVIGGERAVYGYTAAMSRDVVVFAYSDPVTPGDVAVYTPSGGEKRLTYFSDSLREKYRLVMPRRLVVEASDGESIEGWYMEPLGCSSNCPVVIHVHGGPKASYGPFFIFQHQLLANQGYYVVYLNPRGSSGYSEDFADIRCRYGERDYQDIMEYLDAFLEETRGKSSSGKLAITGISYGGFMTNWAITQTNRFKAAVSENGISCWLSDYYTSDIGYWFDPDQICGTPRSNPEGYRRQSPLEYIDKVETPVMIIHSMEDYRCFIDQSVAMHVELVLRGKESRLVVFTKGHHGFSLRGAPRVRVKRLRLILDYLGEKLGGAEERKNGKEGD